MQKNFKKLVASTLACGILFSGDASSLNPKIMEDFSKTFKRRAILHEDFQDPQKFPMADADQILENMTLIFRKYPNIAHKLISRKPLIIQPFELAGAHCPNAPEDSVELLSGVFKYKTEKDADYLFIDVFDTHLVLDFIADELNAYNELIDAEIISLMIYTVICSRHASELETQNHALPDKYFDEIKREIISLAHTKYGYSGSGKLLNGKRLTTLGKEISDSTIDSRSWLLGLISDTLNSTPTLDFALRSAANNWLRQQ